MSSIGILIGTRPEAIKLAPVVHALAERGHTPHVLVTGQHREMLLPILNELEIEPNEDLQLMQPSQTLAGLSSAVLNGVTESLRRRKYRWLVVQGDTTSAAMAALAAFYENVSVAHVEAGLRTDDLRNPFPEEANRRLIGRLATLHCAPTLTARDNLLREGVDPHTVHNVGNTIVDALKQASARWIPQLEPNPMLAELGTDGRMLMIVTCHRRESIGDDMAAICRGVRKIATEFSETLNVLFPVHLNPAVQELVRETLSGMANVHLVEPLGYLRFIEALQMAKLVVTDSGGVQEEAATLGIPLLVVRRTCERMEAVSAGVSQLVGPEENAIFDAAQQLLSNEAVYRSYARKTEAFGDGRAAGRIADLLLETPS
ncbi:MAG: UDP-N-acetylglucosamine 2-epimerase (non-hydrolyzing) [Pirellulales bacterium]